MWKYDYERQLKVKKRKDCVLGMAGWWGCGIVIAFFSPPRHPNAMCFPHRSRLEKTPNKFQTLGPMPLWWEFFTWVKEGTVLHNSPMANFLHTSTTTGGKNITRRRKTWWLAATKSIWQSRNDLVFHNQAFDIHKLIDNSIFLTWTWLKGWEKNFCAPFHHWSSTMEGFVGLDQTYLREVAKEKKHRLLAMLECDEHDARP
ncbi:hypothetical protein GmHk_18G052057 [Glycine max]|nr:hypothetical protein GmHk_18G052057 [Glycine max]